LDEIKDTQDQVKVWEKKIQVEKETQEELHTSKDAIDTKGMEKEIQRMKHRLESLVRTQEQLLRDMELAIHKREDIGELIVDGHMIFLFYFTYSTLTLHSLLYTAVKYKKNTKYDARDSRRQKQSMTKGELNKLEVMAREKLLRLDNSIEEARQSIVMARQDLSQIQDVLKESTHKLSTTLQLRDKLESEVSVQGFEKARLTSLCDLHDELLHRYESLNKGDIPQVAVSARQEFEVEKRFVQSNKEMQKLENIINGLAMKRSKYEDVFDKMLELTRTSER